MTQQAQSEDCSNSIETLSPERQRQLRSILNYSRQMLAFANDREWEALNEVEFKRQQLLVDLCSKPVLLSEARDVALVIREVLDIDGRVIDHVMMARQVLADNLSEIGRGRRAYLAYDENSS